ncbi:hypothetical protein BASA82_000942 [Batrachochytrium salamandrivorans]|nr:hypothetical protein BASA82_000942 [Batrachochytrium salamandrivorans]
MYVLGLTLTWNDTQIQEVLALLVIQTNPDILNYLSTPQRNKPRTAHIIQDPQHQYYTIVRMRLAIASTTILFAMMAAQATGFSATSTADVNIFKRAPTNDDPLTRLSQYEVQKLEELYKKLSDELGESRELLLRKDEEVTQSKELIKKLTYKCQDKTTYACIIGNATIAALKKELVELEEQLKMIKRKHYQRLPAYHAFKKARRENNSEFLRKKYLHNK